ncbi:MAG: polysaccharide biosynthesis C-terminal domain-containing protein, partial [Thermoleophilia bacterium]
AMIVLSGPVEKEDTDVRPAMDVLKYSYPLALANILVAVTLWVDTLMLGYLGTTEDVGFYGVALKIAQFGAKIIMAFIIVFMPVIADLWNRKKSEELKGLYMTVSRWIFTLSFPIFLIIVLFSDAIMRIFGAGFVAGSGALVILAAGQMITATTGAAGLMILMSGHSKVELFNVVVNLTVNVVLCLLLIPGYGVLGAAIAHMSALAVVNTLRVIEVWFFMHIFAYNLSYLKPVLSGLAGGIVALVIGRIFIDSVSLVQLALLACLLLALYIAAIVAMGLEEQDKAILSRVKASLTGAKAA